MSVGNKVVGIDASLSSTGVATAMRELSAIKTTKAQGDARLVTIDEELYRLTPGILYGQGCAVMEDLPRNAMGAGLTGQAQGVIRRQLSERGFRVHYISPASLKKFATGSGRADKKAMRQAWLELSGNDVASDDKVDAGWLWFLGEIAFRHLVQGAPDDALPEHQRKYVLEAIETFGWR